MEAALLQLESSPRDTELLNTIFRGAHSIKGASTTFGIDEVGRFTHVLENLLERLRDGLLETTGPLVELLLTSVDVIDGLIANAKDGAPLPANLEQVFLELQRVNGSTVSQANAIVATTEQTHKSKRAEFRIQLKPSPEFFRFGQEPILLIRELSELGSLHKVSIDARSLPCLSEIQPEECYVAWEIVIATEHPRQAVEDVFMFLDEGSKYSIECLNIVVPSEETVASSNQSPNNTTQPAVVVKPTCAPSESSGDEDKKNAAERVSNKNSTAARGAENETVRVDRQRLDELINQIGELVIGASMVEQELLSIAGGHGLESMGKIGSSLDAFVLWCSHYDPYENRYSASARMLMSVCAGGFVVVGMVGLLPFWISGRRWNKDKRKLLEPNGPQESEAPGRQLATRAETIDHASNSRETVKL